MLKRNKWIKRSIGRHLQHPKRPESSIEKFIEGRDFVGALTFLKFASIGKKERLLWTAYCAFHKSDYETAQAAYIDALSGDYNDSIPDGTISFLACVYFQLQMYEEALNSIEERPECGLTNRLRYHLSYLMGDKPDIIATHEAKLSDSVEDKLCKAAMYYEQGNYQKSSAIFKDLLSKNRGHIALNVYSAMCYFQLDYYDISLETLMVYQQAHSDSILVKNLKACNLFRLYDGNAALNEMKDIANLEKVLRDHELIRHNMVVFTDGQKALQVLPNLINQIPEAKLNLAIFYLRNDQVSNAVDLLEGLEPSNPQEYILKAITSTLGSEFVDDMHRDSVLDEAKSYFESVGTSPSETDTIPGRQCMAQYYFLRNKFEDVNIYLGSIQNFMNDDDVFNWNYGHSLVAVKDFEAAEGILSQIVCAEFKKERSYVASLCRCCIMNGKPDNAWNLVITDDSLSIEDSIYLFQLIANDYYRTHNFVLAAKSYSSLIELNEDQQEEQYINPLVSSCIGAFKDIIEQDKNQKSRSVDLWKDTKMVEIRNILSKHSSNERVDQVLHVVKKWTKILNKDDDYLGFDFYQ